MECEVRVGDILSGPLEVTIGLRQGCVLSLHFSLYINGVMEKLRDAKVDVRWGEEQVPALLMIW